MARGDWKAASNQRTTLESDEEDICTEKSRNPEEQDLTFHPCLVCSMMRRGW